MKIVSLIYATWQGLGIMARDYYHHDIITHPVIVRHGRHENHLEWYPEGTPVIADLRRDTTAIMTEVLKDTDIFLALETPFDWSLIPLCRSMGVKTVICPNHECMPSRIPHEPDLWLCPSLLDFEWACNRIGHPPPPRRVLEICGNASVLFHGRGPDIWFLPVPVDTDAIKYRQRERARVFVHNAGHGGLKGRNGTALILEAMEHIRSPAKFLIRSQESLYRMADHRQHAMLTNPLVRRGQRRPVTGLEEDLSAVEPLEKMVEYRVGTAPHETLYDEGDVFLFPEGFNGLSLPLQEAAAAGMLIMAGNRWPMNAWLHDDPLIPVKGYVKERIGPPYSEYERALYDPKVIAATVDAWYDRDISEYSRMAREWAEGNNWQTLGPVYRGILSELAKK